MDQIQVFLQRVFQYSFLSKNEKNDWIEEMSSHLHLSTEEYESQGYNKVQAVRLAIDSFGSPKEIRDSLTKETYGFKSSTVLFSIFISLTFFIISLIGGVTLERFDIHNRYIEIIPIVLISFFLLSVSVFYTRKSADRFCLLLTPLFFGLGYLQAYFNFMANVLGDGLTFLMFYNLFFPGSYDYQGRLDYMYISVFFLSSLSLIIYMICKNRYIASLPFLLSAVYTLIHIIMFKLYYLFTINDQFASIVSRGHEVFISGNAQRLVVIICSIMLYIIFLKIYKIIDKFISKKKVKVIS
ncbi:permease prefix domain 1-containing protein [Neobacillus mesonae]|nr:permease prefix domain 1-containing protein [Neobacillus mesonae]